MRWNGDGDRCNLTCPRLRKHLVNQEAMVECPLILSDFFSQFLTDYTPWILHGRRGGEMSLSSSTDSVTKLLKVSQRDRILLSGMSYRTWYLLCTVLFQKFMYFVYNQCCIKGGRGRMVPTSVWSGGSSLFMVEM